MRNKREPKAQVLKTPKLASEAEEARWWATHQNRIAAAFEKAASEGRLSRRIENPRRKTDN